MDTGKRMAETIKGLEALKNCPPRELTLPRSPRVLSDSDSDEDFLHIDEEERSEEGQAQIKVLEQAIATFSASLYGSEKSTGPDQDERFCIWPGGGMFSWKESSSGYPWICISGNDNTTCVVTTSDPIRKRPANKTQIGPPTLLEGVLADMMTDMPNSFRNIPPQEFRSGHLAVVSVASYAPDQELELQSLEKRRSLLFRFLEEKLEDRSTLSYKETEQIAICCLKLLVGRSLNPYKIEVCGWGKMNFASKMAFRTSAEHIREALTTMAGHSRL